MNGQIPSPTNRLAYTNSAGTRVHPFIATTHTFVLPAKHPGRVDLYYSSSSGGGHGLTYGEPLDRYAPERLKPVLAQWRKDAAEAALAKSSEKTDRAPQDLAALERRETPRTEAKAASLAAYAEKAGSDGVAVPQSVSRWDEAAAFTDIPKALFKSIKIPGLTLEEELSPEIAALLSLSEEDQKAVMDLYLRMKQSFENVERAHFGRVEPDRNSFVLRAFPDESAALKQEWIERLKVFVGSTRGEILDRTIRTEISSHPFLKHRKLGIEMILHEGEGFGSGRGWLHRGSEEMRLNVTPGFDRQGRPMFNIDYKTGGEGGERGSGGVRQIPKRWQHLLTPNMLGLPVSL